MKIGYFGNMNNIGFTIVRYLRDLGYDIDLLLFDDELNHFLPYCDTFDLKYQQFVRQLSWGSVGPLVKMPKEQIRHDIDVYDLTIGCGYAPAYFEKAGKKLDIFTPYGWDIWGLTKAPDIWPLPHRWKWLKPYKLQRRGISKCSVFHMSPADEMYENQAGVLAPNAERWLEGLPMVYTKEYDFNLQRQIEKRSHWGHLFREIREQCDFLIVYHSRHDWTRDTSDPCNKGTAKLLKGFARFVKSNQNVRAHLITLEYGQDVAESRKLINELGIQNVVTWFPKMYRKDIIPALQLADIVCGQFENSWITYGAINEALTVSKPILTYRDDSQYAKSYPELYAILCARNDMEVYERLQEFVAAPEPYIIAASGGRSWYEKNVVEPGLARYCDFFEAAR